MTTFPAPAPADADGLLDQLRERARELGFAACRVAAARPPEQSVHFAAWLDAGHAGDMSSWLERSRAKRSDPALVLPGVRSVLVLAMSYWQDGPNSAAGQGRIARYAWGDDYHELIAGRLEQMAELLAAAGGTQRCYVDTGPILERSFAAEAGVGWQGKSTMLLSRELGTWFFLAEILTTLELPADPPAAAHCGKCTRCLDACPTAAISPARPFRLEARRCLSYLTIEHKGSIPVEFRGALGDRIYGCDDCLDACPWNRFAQRSREVAFQLRPAMAGRPLREYLELDDDTFRLLFHGSPIRRIKRRGFLRNVCVALGNVGGPDDLPALRRAAADPEPLVAEHAVWAVGQIEQRLRVTSTSGAPQI